MEEGRRRYYLQALEIPLWLVRFGGVLPFREAAPTNLGERTTAVPLERSHNVPNNITSIWDTLQTRVAACTACNLHTSRTQTVFGVGDQQADWMIIGEAPGAEEDRLGEPFVGRAGQLLNAMLAAIGLAREKVFIANILKCRPPQNRDPKPQEVASCANFLQEQVHLVQPKVMLVVGRIAAQNLLHTNAPVGRLRGRRFCYEKTGIPLVVTYHPAYLLRSPAQKAKAWQDLKLVRSIYKEINIIKNN